MDRATVYTKTAKGITQVNQKSASLSKDLMKVLKLIDGKSNFGQLLEKAELDKNVLEKALNTLAKDGFARVFETRKEELDPFAAEEDDFDFTAPKKLPGATQRVMAGAALDITELARQQEKADADRKSKENAHEQARVTAKAQAEARARADAEAKARQQAEQAAMEQARRAKDAADRAKAELDAKMREEETRRVALASQQAKLTAEQKVKEEEEGRRLAELRVRAEREAKALGEARARAEAEAAAMAKARAEAEAAAKKLAVDAVQAEAAMKARLKEEIEGRIRQEMEDLLRNEVEEQTRAEMQKEIMAEAKLAAKAELEERLREERQAIAKAETEARSQAEIEATARAASEAKKRAEAEARAQAETEARIRAEEENRQLRAKAEEDSKRLRAAADEQARKAKEIEARSRAEAEAAAARAKGEAEERARATVAAAEARAKAEAERARSESAARARDQAEAEQRVNAERQAKYEAEARAKIEAEERDKRERALAATIDAERKAKEEAEARVRVETRARETIEVDTRAKVQAELESDMAKRAEIEGKAQAAAYMTAKAKAEHDEDDRVRAEQARRAREIADVLRTKVERDDVAPDSSPAAKRRHRRRNPHMVRNVMFALIGGLVLAIAAVHVIPMRGLAAKVERTMSQWLSDDVSISATTFRLIPSPHLRVEGLSVGKSLDAKATHGRIYLDLATLMSENLAINAVELEDVKINAEAVRRILPVWARKEGKAQSTIGTIRLRDVDLAIAPNPGKFDAYLQFNGDGTFRQATLSSGTTWTLGLKPGDKGMDLDFGARYWTLPMGVPIAINDVRMKGVLSGSELVVPEFEAAALDGAINGTLRVNWSQGVKVESDLALARVSSKLLVAAFTKDVAVTGRVEGNFSFVTEGPTLDKVFTTPRASGKFKIAEGSISNVDLVAVMQSDSAGTRAGVTKFGELSGEFGSVNHGATYRNIVLQGGVLRGNGQLDIGNNSNLSGRLALEIRSQVAQDRGAFSVSGTVSRPIVKRGG